MCGPLTTFSLQVLNGPSTTTPDGTRMGILHRTVPSSQEVNEDEKHHGACGCIQPAKSLSWRLETPVARGPFTPRSLADPCGSPYEVPLIVRVAWDINRLSPSPGISIFRGSPGRYKRRWPSFVSLPPSVW